MNRARGLLLLAGACLLLTGCFRYEQRIKVEDSGSVSVERIMAADVDQVSPEDLGLEGDSFPRGFKGGFCDGLRDGAKQSVESLGGPSASFLASDVDNYSKDGYCGVKARWTLADAPDHSGALSIFLEQPTRLVNTAVGWEFETQIMFDELISEGDLTSEQTAILRERAEYRLVLELPGQPVEGAHNATSVSGSTFTWDVDLNSPPPRLYAQSEPATGLNRIPISPKVMGVILANLCVLSGVAWFFLRDETATGPSQAVAPVPVGAGTFATPAESAAATPMGTPYYDESYGIWMLHDPVRGLLWHRAGTDEWVEF